MVKASCSYSRLILGHHNLISFWLQAEPYLKSWGGLLSFLMIKLMDDYRFPLYCEGSNRLEEV